MYTNIPFAVICETRLKMTTGPSPKPTLTMDYDSDNGDKHTDDNDKHTNCTSTVSAFLDMQSEKRSKMNQPY